MQNKSKSNVADDYSKLQQGSLVGKGNEVLARAENIKDTKKDYANSIDTPPLEDVEHGKTYGKKEYHGI